MKIDYPKVQIDEDDNVVYLKANQLFSDVAFIYQAHKRVEGSLTDKSFFLPHDYDWIIVKDDHDQLCLVPLKKGSKI